MPTIPIKWLTDSNANKRYPVTHTKAVFNDDGDDLDTILSGLGGSLAGLSDTTITSPSNGQVLTYDGTSSKWINAASSGGGIQTLTSPIRIWDLDPGLYIIPNPCTVYYSGATSTTSLSISGGGILNVWWQTENTSKNWVVWTNAWSSAWQDYPTTMYCGYTTSSGGTQKAQTAMFTSGSSTVNNVSNFVGVLNYSTQSGDLNSSVLMSARGTGIHLIKVTTTTTNLPSGVTITEDTYCAIVTINSRAIKAADSVTGYVIRQELYFPQLNQHYYRNVQYYNNTFTPDTSIPNCDSNGWVKIIETYPLLTGNAGKVLAVNSGATGVEWVSSSGGTADYDFTHTSNTTVSTATTTITFAANKRCSQMITISADLGISVVCNNLSDNYLWINNTGSSEVDITINSFSLNGNTVSNVYMPSDGISVPAGNVCEIGIVCNADGAFIASRNDLAL